jgi:translation initiation factor 1
MSSNEDMKDVLTRLDQEGARITVKLEFRRFRKMATVIEGLNINRENLVTLASKLKRKLATGGTAKEGTVILQGDQRSRIPDLLVAEGFQRESIDVA